MSKSSEQKCTPGDKEKCAFICDKCKKAFQSEYELKNHEIFSHYKFCPLCNLEVMYMRNHFNDKHRGTTELDGCIKLRVFNDIQNKFRLSQCNLAETNNKFHKNDVSKLPFNFKEEKDLRNAKQISKKPNLSLKLFASEQKVAKAVNCLFCSFKDEDGTVVEQHVNSEHLDIISPSNKSTDTYPCPLCNCICFTVDEIESHVIIVHKDVISPQKIEDEELSKEYISKQHLCPVCEVMVCDNTEKLDAHLKTHYDEAGLSPVSPIISSDDFIAKEMQKGYKESLKQIEKRDFQHLQAQFGMDNNGNFKEQSMVNMEQAVRLGELSVNDYYEKQAELKAAESIGIDDGSSRIQNVIPYILNRSNNSHNVEEAYLCDNMDYYLATYGDRGWGCGYRNMQMLLSCLLRHDTYYEHLQQLWRIPEMKEISTTGQNMPSISRLQRAIEWAWKLGFDVQGCEQLGGRLHNTRKWIGATEVVALLSCLRLRCELLDFHELPDKNCHSELSDWLISYFKKDGIRYPLYLQHQGHSRTVVGVEQLKNGNYLLLILDPGCNYQQMRTIKTGKISDVPISLIRKTVFNLKNIQYQLVKVLGVMESEVEYLGSKIIKSTRIC